MFTRLLLNSNAVTSHTAGFGELVDFMDFSEFMNKLLKCSVSHPKRILMDY